MSLLTHSIGYKPILKPSPDSRRGKLYSTAFREVVNLGDGYRHIYECGRGKKKDAVVYFLILVVFHLVLLDPVYSFYLGAANTD